MLRRLFTGAAARGVPGLALGAVLALAPAPVASASVLDDSRLLTLDNGMRVLLAPDSTAAAVDVAVWYDASPRTEAAGQGGIAHLFEHLMFEGTTRVGAGEFRRRIEAEGGTAEAYTTSDLSCFYETVPPAALETALMLEADRMTSLALTEGKLAAQKARVRQERMDRARGNPFVRGLDRLYAIGFPQHPYGRPVLGTERDVERITLAQLRDFYRTRYAPGGALLTVVGRFDPDTALGLVRKHLGSLAGRAAAAPPAREPAPAPPGRAVEPGEYPFRVLFAGWRGPAARDDDTPLLTMLSVVLSGGGSSRLQSELVENRPLALFARGSHEAQREGSLFYALVGVAPQADSATVERELVAQVERLGRDPVSGEDLERARRQVEMALLFDAQTARGRGRILGTAQMLEGDAGRAGRHIERVRSATAEDLRAVAARYLKPDQCSFVWMPAGKGGQP
jgi:zinc protease